ncbi:MAG: M64 family metallopeptidase, partial [archaeon]|nr:M64 family metallopeptidase [archaeon]
MNNKFIGCSIVLLIIFLLALFVYAQENFTVSSVSTSDVITRTTQPSQVYWIINTQFNGGGQYITGTINPNTIKGFMNGKASSSQPLTITAEAVNEQVFYDVSNEGVPIYKYRVESFDAPDNCILGICYAIDNPQPCPGTPSWNFEFGKSVFQYTEKRYCIYKEQKGIKGTYNNPTINFSARITAQAGSITKQKTICSGAVAGCDGSSINFDDLGVATWSGSLITGDSPPNQDQFVAIKRSDNNRWQIARRPTFETYLPLPQITNSQLDGLISYIASRNDEDQIAYVDSLIATTLTPVNQAADVLLAEDTSFTASPFTKDGNTGRVTITLNRRLTSPNIVFRIRADWIGLVIPSGKPKILNVSTEKFASGESGTINVQIQNVGDVAGTFSVILEGCEPFIQSTTSATSRETIQAGDIKNISIGISGGNISEQLSKTCKVKAYDINDPSSSDSSSVTIELEQAKACIPGKIFADGQSIKRCKADGSGIELVRNCDSGVISDGQGGFTCNQSSQTTSNPQCETDLDCGTGNVCVKELGVCAQKSGCVLVNNNGLSSDKVDIAFVGDEYFENDELKRDVQKIVNEGLFSVEPFKSNSAKFNVWMIRAENKIPVG